MHQQAILGDGVYYISKFNISLKEVSQHVTASHFAFAWSHSCLVKYNGQSFIIQKREVISKVSFLELIIFVPIKKFKLQFDLPIAYWMSVVGEEFVITWHTLVQLHF